MYECWKNMIESALKEHNESWEDVEYNTLSEEEMKRKFDTGYGGEEGTPFTVWTSKRVYFPGCYDGAEWVDSVSRIIDKKPTSHIGG